MRVTQLQSIINAIVVLFVILIMRPKDEEKS
jgi:hypothetical protein